MKGFCAVVGLLLCAGAAPAGCAPSAPQAPVRSSAPARATTAAPTQPTDAPVALSFRTISQGDNLVEGRMSDQPSLRIITSAEQVNLAIPQDDRTPDSFAHVTADQVRGIDYDRFFAIIVLHGVQGSGGFKVTIQRIERQGDLVRVQAQFVSPDPSQGVAAANTDPYHIVQVAKDGVWGGPIRFTLTDTDNDVRVEMVRDVP